MDIGILSFQTGYSVDPAVLAKRAEELGFESYFVPNLPIVPVNTPSRDADYADGATYSKTLGPASNVPQDKIVDTSAVVDPFVALARASAVTKTIKLGTGVCLVPEHNPLLLAKQVATLDHLSGGRFIFGIGSGGLKEQSEIMGIRLSPPVDPDSGRSAGHEGTLGQGRVRIPRDLLRLPSGEIFPQAGPKAAPADISGRHGAQCP